MGVVATFRARTENVNGRSFFLEARSRSGWLGISESGKDYGKNCNFVFFLRIMDGVKKLLPWHLHFFRR